MVKVKAPAKINLFLEVTARRADGYHDLATLFARIGLCDELSFRKTAAAGIKLKTSGGAIGLKDQADNIVYKAAAEFFRVFGLCPAVEITLKKNIPVGAGLGGGSSDAAAALLGLAKLYRLPKAAGAKLLKIAAGLGSDVPFFMLEAGAAEGAGRGEKLKEIEFSGRLPHIVLVYPGVPVYTREVYGRLKLGDSAAIKRRLADFKKLLGLLRRGEFTRGRAALLFNRLEDPVLPAHKAVRLAKERLAGAGAEAVLMSGSGASVFGLCWEKAKARRVADALKSIRGYRIFLTNFC
ncbi:MAG: 4-(cytidine 5'-diphospho)-2-C-methyl-D-erythritol kinase [Elusimicrobia bacterium GWA2_61_42]|nr:MAG: 4-(cytidine 5'-diphospho)-2-C-methyl-D-erythritol kinase [Elusimicrobia bacterium GWA2_61_42]OGR78723.1 MAG: 4-(cytidine 5'-diphospho)-2-C-methyl-D-erythritol kinase [Elusimicrobia bacterium GWC2_61_25]